MVRDRDNTSLPVTETNKHSHGFPNLPLQHSKSLHGLILVSVSIFSNQWALTVQSPSLCERWVEGFLVKPGKKVMTTITKMFCVSLNLVENLKETVFLGDVLSTSFSCSIRVKEFCRWFGGSHFCTNWLKSVFCHLRLLRL